MKKIALILTGGTIAGKADDKGYKAGLNEDENLINSLNLNKIAKIKIIKAFSKPSQDIEFKDALNLAKITQNALKKCDGALILHGSDTLEESAYLLNLLVKTKKPIVFTGSMRTPNQLSSDAGANIVDALKLCICKKARGLGVMLSFNSKIYPARNIVKVNTTNLDAFDDKFQIGEIIGNEVKIYFKTLRKFGLKSEFRLSDFKNKAKKVGIIYAYQDFKMKISSKFDGLIIAGLGNGNLNKFMLKRLSKLEKKGVCIIRNSRCQYGIISQNGEEKAFLRSDDLSPQKARILLLLALNKTKNKKKIQKIFDEY